MKYFLIENNEFTKFHFTDFILNQKKINKKFPCPYKTNYDIIDKMINAVTEECYEILIAKDLEEEQEELVDVVMYLGSFYNELYFLNFLKEIPDDLNKIEFNLTKHEFKKSINIKKMIKSLYSIRRYFPERKYHKKFNNKDIVEYRYTLCLNIIEETIKYILENNVVNYEKFEEKLLYKQDYILNL